MTFAFHAFPPGLLERRKRLGRKREGRKEGRGKNAVDNDFAMKSSSPRESVRCARYLVHLFQFPLPYLLEFDRIELRNKASRRYLITPDSVNIFFLLPLCFFSRSNDLLDRDPAGVNGRTLKGKSGRIPCVPFVVYKLQIQSFDLSWRGTRGRQVSSLILSVNRS